MILNGAIAQGITEKLAEVMGTEGKLKIVAPVSGGSINSCWQVFFNENSFFVKVNSAVSYPGMFKAEAAGLGELQSHDVIKVPDVIGEGQIDGYHFLILEWINPGRNTVQSQELFGRQLADLHRIKHAKFGLDYNNYMGSLPQPNKLTETYTEFFIEYRLKPQVKIALAKKILPLELERSFNILYGILGSMLDKEVFPSLVHGDLWSGNYLIDTSGVPVLIDPAISFSYREVDIAMTTLFGGFDNRFYDSYHESFPLAKGWQERMDLWNLYPLLIHLNLFGRGYLRQIQAALNKYV